VRSGHTSSTGANVFGPVLSARIRGGYGEGTQSKYDGVSEDRFLFAEELRALRKLKGWTPEECGAAINYSASTIKSIESCYRAPTAEQARLLDEAFGTPGTLQRCQRRIRGIPLSASFRPFAPYEAEATVLRTFVRNSVRPEAGSLSFTFAEWAAHTKGRPELGVFDLPEGTV
jgi:transcriptional regulator with XRE-family HTH domain